MNVEIETEAKLFLFRDYLFQIFGIVSLQCVYESAWTFFAQRTSCSKIEFLPLFFAATHKKRQIGPACCPFKNINKRRHFSGGGGGGRGMVSF